MKTERMSQQIDCGVEMQMYGNQEKQQQILQRFFTAVGVPLQIVCMIKRLIFIHCFAYASGVSCEDIHNGMWCTCSDT